MSAFVRVILDRSIRRELDYAVPEAMVGKVVVGSRVRVPFRDKSLLATVVATLAESPAEGIKLITALLGEKPVLSASLIELARWMANYYCCPIETVMRSLLPQVIRKAEVGWKKQLFVSPARSATAEEIEKLRRRAPRQAELLEAILQLGAPMPAADLLHQTSLDNSTLRALVRRGFAELREQAVERDPHGDGGIRRGRRTGDERRADRGPEADRNRVRKSGNASADPAPRGHRQRQDGSVSPGNPCRPRARQDGDRARPRDFADAADGRAFQEPFRRTTGHGRGPAQPFVGRRAARRVAQDCIRDARES